MNDLIRRALLGDRKAQEECTRQGIALPCPCCGGEAAEKMEGALYFGAKIVCKKCGMGTESTKMATPSGNRKAALTAWNTRPAPPIGRCETCGYWIKTTCYCWKSKVFGQSCRKDEYCSSWTSKEEANHATD